MVREHQRCKNSPAINLQDYSDDCSCFCQQPPKPQSSSILVILKHSHLKTIVRYSYNLQEMFAHLL